MPASMPATVIKLAVTEGVPSANLAKLLAWQRAEEPQTPVEPLLVSAGESLSGLQDGRFDLGISLQDHVPLPLHGLPLWRGNLAAALPPQSPLASHKPIALDELMDVSLLRWQGEPCAALDERISMARRRFSIQVVTSFEMMAMMVVAGLGVGISAHSRITQAQPWGICLRPLADGPYEVVAHLLRPTGHLHPATERFVQRVLRVAANT